MEISVAKKILAILRMSNQNLNQLIHFSKGVLSKDEYAALIPEVGTMMGASMFIEGPIYRQHPSLAPKWYSKKSRPVSAKTVANNRKKLAATWGRKHGFLSDRESAMTLASTIGVRVLQKYDAQKVRDIWIIYGTLFGNQVVLRLSAKDCRVLGLKLV